MKDGVSGVTIVRNAVLYGYPLYYSVKSVIDACDEFIISEGCSEDSTLEVINKLAHEYPEKIVVIHKRWPRSKRGEAIAEVTTDAIEHSRYSWIYYIQADEFVHEFNLPLIKQAPRMLAHFNCASFKFIHLRPTLNYVIPSYSMAIRLFRNLTTHFRRTARRCLNKIFPAHQIPWNKYLKPIFKRNIPLEIFKDIYPFGDAYTFTGCIDPIYKARAWKPIYHVGYITKDHNALLRRLEARWLDLYSVMPHYRDTARIATEDITKVWPQAKPYVARDYPAQLLRWAREEELIQ